VAGVDLSDGTFTQWRMSRTRFDDCRFDRATFEGLRTYSARFDRCSFIDADLREASLGGWTTRWRRRAYGARYTDCNFTNADLRHLNVDHALLRRCSFVGSRWRGTRTMSAVFEECDFRDATLREVMFDGRELGAGVPRRRGTNRLAGCDFSTAHLRDCSFMAIDFRDCVPPAGPGLVLIDTFPARAQAAMRYLHNQPGSQARTAAAILDIAAGRWCGSTMMPRSWRTAIRLVGRLIAVPRCSRSDAAPRLGSPQTTWSGSTRGSATGLLLPDAGC